MGHRVLVVDDDETTCELLKLALGRLGHEAVLATSGREALERIDEADFDLVLCDIEMAGMDGFELCRRVGDARPGLPVVMVTGQNSMDSAVAALRAGAYDFVLKPVDEVSLGACVGRAGRARMLQLEVGRLRRQVENSRPLDDVVGMSSAMRRVFEMVGRAAPTDASVLIEGETGTGKELVARALHTRSLRANGPFVAINCAAVPANLIESELFGHARGAFTDAKNAREGLFVQANGGTLFLDEIGELPMEVQPKLLRALQERKVRPLGSNSEISFDARILAATNRDLETRVEERQFRQDLYYRINVLKIQLPPLRERGADVLALAQHLLDRIAPNRKLSVSPEAAHKLMGYDWPGNVRELENCMERAAALASSEQIVVQDLPEKVRAHRADRVMVCAEDASELVTFDELERRYIRRALKMLRGNKSRTAELLGLDRRTLYRKLERYEEQARTAGSAPPVHVARPRPTMDDSMPMSG
jgi:two-component system response regulator HydG